MSEQQQHDNSDLSGLNLTISATDWDNAGLNKPGPVGVKIDSARLESRVTKNGKVAVCALETSVLQREGGRVEGEKFFDTIFLTPLGLRQFKNLAAGAGIKPAPGQAIAIPEVVRALNGKTVFGRIVHREYTKDGEKQLSANFGKKFGPTMASVTT